jgi:hypothetical protein
MQPGRYLISFFLCFASLLGGLAALNIHHDPSGLLTAIGLKNPQPSANDRAIAPLGFYPMPHGSREAKFYNYLWYKPKTVVLGSSNVWSYIDVFDPRLRDTDGRPAFNFGVAGILMYEVDAVVRHAVAAHKPNRVILDLEFFMFGGHRRIMAGKSLDKFPLAYQPNYRWELAKIVAPKFIALEPTLQSLRTGIESAAKAFVAAAFGAEGLPVALSEEQQAVARRRLHVIERGQIHALYRPDTPFSFEDEDGLSTLTALRNVLALARTEGIELRIFISPHQARAYEIIRALGLWDKYLFWLREMVKIVDDVNTGRPCNEQVQVLDFGAYKPFNLDLTFIDVEPPLYRSYSDSFHYYTNTGKTIIGLVLAASACNEQNSKIATVLSPDRIEQHIAAMEEARARFAAEHPDEVADVVALVRGVANR